LNLFSINKFIKNSTGSKVRTQVPLSILEKRKQLKLNINIVADRYIRKQHIKEYVESFNQPYQPYTLKVRVQGDNKKPPQNSSYSTPSIGTKRT